MTRLITTAPVCQLYYLSKDEDHVRMFCPSISLSSTQATVAQHIV